MSHIVVHSRVSCCSLCWRDGPHRELRGPIVGGCHIRSSNPAVVHAQPEATACQARQVCTMIRPARRLALVFLVAAACICAGVRAGSRPSLWAEELDWEDRAGQVQSDVADGGHACSCAPLQALPPPQLPCTLLGIQEGASYPAAGAPVELVCDDDKQSHASPYSRVSMRVELDGIPIPPNQRLAARGVGLHRLQTAVIATVPPAVNKSSGDGARICGPCATVFTGSGAYS